MPAAVPAFWRSFRAIVQSLRGFHLRTNRVDARSIGDDLQIGVRRGRDDQVAGVHHGKLRGAPILR